MQESPAHKVRSPNRLSLILIFVASALLTAVLSTSAWLYYQIAIPLQHADAIEQSLHSLKGRRPADMTRGQWGSAVAWTLNLHGNSLLAYEADRRTLEQFQDKLEQRLTRQVNMSTIDWIWSEYALLTRAGASYQRFRIQMEEEIAQVGPETDVWGMNVP